VLQGNPLQGAKVDVWQADTQANYNIVMANQ